MWFIGVEVEQETSAPPPKKNPGSAPAFAITRFRYVDVPLHMFNFTITEAKNIDFVIWIFYCRCI